MYNNEENKWIILFEGEYLNGKKWNGVEKKFRSIDLYYEGEYLHGKLWNCKYCLDDKI